LVTCARLVAELSNLLDGDVDGPLRGALERHLAQCPACLVLHKTARQTVSFPDATQPYGIPEDARMRLGALIHHRLKIH
jgi:anti-sigma factor RsiW